MFIYKITFDSGDTYIGQTANFARRKYNHFTQRGKGSPKLEAAFRKQPTPTMEIIDTATEDNVNELEAKYIEELNPSLNTLPGGEPLRGLNSPKARYTREQILKVVDLFLNSVHTYTEISELTGVKQGALHDVLKQRTHSWATEAIPYHKIEEARALRSPKKRLYSPTNELFEADTIAELSSVTGLRISSISSILNSSRGYSDSGWAAYPHETVQLVFNGEATTMTMGQARLAIKEDETLSPFQIKRILAGKKSQGWQLKKLTTLLP